MNTKERKRQKEERTSVPRPLSWNIYASKFVNICVGVFEEVRVSVIYTNCPSERYNQIVRRTV